MPGLPVGRVQVIVARCMPVAVSFPIWEWEDVTLDLVWFAEDWRELVAFLGDLDRLTQGADSSLFVLVFVFASEVSVGLACLRVLLQIVFGRLFRGSWVQTSGSSQLATVDRRIVWEYGAGFQGSDRLVVVEATWVLVVLFRSFTRSGLIRGTESPKWGGL